MGGMTTGSTSSYAGFSSGAPAKGPSAGFDPILKKKKKVKEETIDDTTSKSRSRFRKMSIVKPDSKIESETEIQKYTESKSFEEFREQCDKVIKANLNEDVFDRLHRISNEKFPQRVTFLDRTIIHVDPLTAKFIVNSFESVDPQTQKLFREMMNRNILAFMHVLYTIKQRKK